jgi:voltage-gated potassium channel
MNWIKKIHIVTSREQPENKLSIIYDYVMLVMILGSVVPLMFVNDYPIFEIIECVTVSAFIVDYICRWLTADIRLKRGLLSYFLYPITPMAIIDLLSILPGLGIINKSLKLLRLTRLLKVTRILKVFRYSNRIAMFIRVLNKERHVLCSVLIMAVLYIFITALIMFNAEPHVNPRTGQETFHSFFDALYWATVTLTTVGYGDLCPVTNLGRMVSMLSSIFGVAIIALPSGVITASYLDELRISRTIKSKRHEQ